MDRFLDSFDAWVDRHERLFAPIDWAVRRGWGVRAFLLTWLLYALPAILIVGGGLGALGGWLLL